jgi:hypothetical protein
MIFGQSVNFKVESVCIGSTDGRLYGGFRFHIADRPIGNLGDVIELTSSARWARTFLKAAPRRVRADLDSATTAEVFDIVYQRYISGVSQTRTGNTEIIPAHQLESWDRDPYLLDDIGESSIRDKYTILVIGTSGGEDRIILKSHIDEALNEFTVNRGHIDHTFYEYCAWVDELGAMPVLPVR